MKNEILIAVRATIVTLVLTGLIYPLAMTGVCQAILGDNSSGSLIEDEQSGSDGQKAIIGSSLIGQPFAQAGYLQPRPSAAGANGYDAGASSGSNLGPTSKKLHDRVQGDVERLQRENPDADAKIPAQLVTASASGLDPHLSPQAALWQVPRIAKARGIEPDRVKRVVESMIEERTFGILGEPRVNVLKTNLALDHQFGRAASHQP